MEIDEAINQNFDEIGQLDAHFNQMVIYSKDSLIKISSVAVSLLGSSQELASSSEKVNSTSEKISAISRQMAKGSMEKVQQINTTIQISQNLK